MRGTVQRSLASSHWPRLHWSAAPEQSRGAPGTHTPALQVSFAVQNLPSSHGSVLFRCSHRPLPLHTSSVQVLRSPSHPVPIGSSWQLAEQQSPFAVLESSHCSSTSTVPLPQRVRNTATASSLKPTA